MSTKNRAPQAFVIDEAPQKSTKPAPHRRAAPIIDFAPLAAEHETAIAVRSSHLPVSRSWRWGNVLIGALFTLFMLWAGLNITQVIEAFFARSPFLGMIAAAIAGLAGLAAIAIILREIWGLARLRRIEKLQLTAAHAINQDDESSASQTVNGLIALYQGNPNHSWNLRNYATHAKDILDPRDRVRLAERLLVDPLDEAALIIIAKRAKRVTLLTTVTPAAALDILFVGAQNIAMLRELATLYGGRPSTFATLRLARMVVTHLAIAGGLALTENFIHLFVGKGILGRLSARFGEGAVNGILTSRIGLAACDVCRPIPKEANKREKLGGLLKELANLGPTQSNTESL
jgi:putative membrane protein